MAFPNPRAISGRRLLPPKSRKMTRTIINNCGPRMFVINARFKSIKLSMFTYLTGFLLNSTIIFRGLIGGGFESYWFV